MNLIRKYKINKLTPCLNEKETEVFNFIKNILSNLKIFPSVFDTENTHFMNEKGVCVFSVFEKEYSDGYNEIELRMNYTEYKPKLVIKYGKLSYCLFYDYCISIKDIEDIIKLMLKEFYNLDLKEHSFKWDFNFSIVEEQYKTFLSYIEYKLKDYTPLVKL